LSLAFYDMRLIHRADLATPGIDSQSPSEHWIFSSGTV